MSKDSTTEIEAKHSETILGGVVSTDNKGGVIWKRNHQQNIENIFSLSVETRRRVRVSVMPGSRGLSQAVQEVSKAITLDTGKSASAQRFFYF